MSRYQHWILALVSAIILSVSAGCDDGIPLYTEWETTETGSSFFDYDEMERRSNQKQINMTYYLPYHSGERYTASTYSGHGEAWDFNWSGSNDCDEPVIAVANGRINYLDSTCDNCTSGWGNYVLIDHDDDQYFSRYAHLARVFVVTGQWVERGQAIGIIGSTGNTTGCHLHFQVEDSSGTSYGVKFRYYEDGKKKTDYLSDGKSYTSYNHRKIAAARERNGKSNVGEATQLTATRVDYDGFSKTFTGGTFGKCQIYYQALGCKGGDFCPNYNNTNSAWLVRTGFYQFYEKCGGPQYCSLGFPTGDEFSISGGARQNFEHGYLIYSSSTKTVTSHSY